MADLSQLDETKPAGADSPRTCGSRQRETRRLFKEWALEEHLDNNKHNTERSLPLQHLAAAPGSPDEGELWWNTTSLALEYYKDKVRTLTRRNLIVARRFDAVPSHPDWTINDPYALVIFNYGDVIGSIAADPTPLAVFPVLEDEGVRRNTVDYALVWLADHASNNGEQIVLGIRYVPDSESTFSGGYDIECLLVW